MTVRFIAAVIFVGMFPMLSVAQVVALEKVCLPGEERSGDKERYISELLKVNQIQFTPALLGKGHGPDGLYDLLEAINPGDLLCSSSEKNCESAEDIKSKIQTFLDATAPDPRFVIEWVESTPKPTGREGLKSFLRTGSASYKFECRPELVSAARQIIARADEKKAAACSKSDSLCLGLDRLQIAKSTDDFRKKDKKKRDPLKVTLSFDQANPIKVENEDGSVTKIANEDVSFNGAFALVDILNAAEREDDQERGKDLTPLISPFVSLAYDENRNAAKEIDDLSIGFVSTWRLPFVKKDSLLDNLRPELSLSWITDIEQRESAQWAAAAKLPLPLQDLGAFGRLLSGSGYGGAAQEVRSLRPAWFVTGVVDFGDIVEAGDKTSLDTIEEYHRIGYDVSADWLLLTGGPALPRTSLEIDYYFRDDISGEPANADLLSGAVTFKPSEASDFSLSLIYERGESLTSLTEQESWKLGFGYKR